MVVSCYSKIPTSHCNECISVKLNAINIKEFKAVDIEELKAVDCSTVMW